MNQDPTLTVFAVLALTAMMICIFFAARSLIGKSSQRREYIPAERDSQPVFVQSDAPSRCFCGEAATEAMPILKRDRGGFDFFRRLYAAPPRYVRFVDTSRPPELCRVHAHVADAKMDEFIFTRVRGIFAEANAKVATEAAGFERESMLKYLNDSLTDREKKNLRSNQATNNVVSLKAANGDGRDSAQN